LVKGVQALVARHGKYLAFDVFSSRDPIGLRRDTSFWNAAAGAEVSFEAGSKILGGREAAHLQVRSGSGTDAVDRQKQAAPVARSAE
jgi:hypothetical protein